MKGSTDLDAPTTSAVRFAVRCSVEVGLAVSGRRTGAASEGLQSGASTGHWCARAWMCFFHVVHGAFQGAKASKWPWRSSSPLLDSGACLARVYAVASTVVVPSLHGSRWCAHPGTGDCMYVSHDTE